MDNIREINLQSQLNNALEGLKIHGNCESAKVHRHLAFMDVRLEPGTPINRIESRKREIALALRSKTAPVVKVLPERGIVQLQVAMHQADVLSLNDIIDDFVSDDKALLPFVLGETVSGKKLTVDMSKNPHLLVAGGTGSGKSVFLHTLIANAFLLSTSKIRNVEVYLCDPKQVEFRTYAEPKYNHIIKQVVTEYDDVIKLLERIKFQMDCRYNLLQSKGLTNIEDAPDIFSCIMVIIDEVGDLILHDNSLPPGHRGKLQHLLTAITQKARAAGIYLIAATQHPDRNVIKGVIKTNFPARVACRVSSGVASRIILDELGAENLLGQGDAIFKSGSIDSERFQVAYTTPQDLL